MKKSFLAAAVLSAFAGTALAADVTLYGVVDTSLLATQVKDKFKFGDSYTGLKLSKKYVGAFVGLRHNF